MEVQSKTRKRKHFTPEFKREAVRPVTQGGLSMAQVAQDLGLNHNTIEPMEKGSPTGRTARISRSRASPG